MSRTIAPERQPSSADLDWNRPVAHPRHGDAPEFRTVSDASHARSRGDGGRFHAGSGGPEHCLGPLASAGRRDRRPLRSAHHDDGGRGDLRRWPGHHGCGPRRARADHLRRADRHGLVMHGDVIGDDRSCACGFGGAAEHDARSCLRGRIARHPRGAARHPGAARARAVADRGAVFRAAGGRDAARCLLRRRRRSDSRAQHGNDLHARGARPGHAEPTVSRDVGGLFRLRPQSRIPDHAFAGLSGDLRPGSDAERGSACRDRRRELASAHC